MKKIEIIKVIRSLITMNNDRIQGYETAARATHEFELKALFAEFILTSRKCNNQLVAEVESLKDATTKKQSTSGRFFRTWTDVKAALALKNRSSILKSCAFGEQQTKDKYSAASKDEMGILSVQQQLMLTTQISLLKVDQDHIKAMRIGLSDA